LTASTGWIRPQSAAELLKQTQDFTLDPDHDPQWVDSLLVRRHAQLHVTATPR
jgi:hypothetical protein